MADYLAKIKFVQRVDHATWHENWYLTAGSSLFAIERVEAYCKLRANLMADDVQIVRYSVSDVEIPRDARVWEGIIKGNKGNFAKPIARDADYPDIGILARLHATDTIWRHILFRGLPDNLMGGQQAELGLKAFEQEFNVLLTHIKDDAQFRIRHISPTPPKVGIKTITVNADNFRLTLDAGPVAAVGQKVIIRGVIGPSVNGTWQVYDDEGAANILVIKKRGIEPRDVRKLGTVQLLEYDYALIVDGQELRVSSRRTSMPLVNKKGTRRQSR